MCEELLDAEDDQDDPTDPQQADRNGQSMPVRVKQGLDGQPLHRGVEKR